MAVRVGSKLPSKSGSSVTKSGKTALLTVPWLEIAVTPLGTDAAISAEKSMVTWPPSPVSVPTSTLTLEPEVVMRPWLAVTEPGTSCVLGSSVSWNLTPASDWLPLLLSTTW